MTNEEWLNVKEGDVLTLDRPNTDQGRAYWVVLCTIPENPRASDLRGLDIHRIYPVDVDPMRFTAWSPRVWALVSSP